jgi:hypothetical protein
VPTAQQKEAAGKEIKKIWLSPETSGWKRRAEKASKNKNL